VKKKKQEKFLLFLNYLLTRIVVYDKVLMLYINYWECGFIQEVARMRVTVTLACTECKQRNYTSTKNKKNDPDRIEMKKYCKFCKTHTAHKETK